MVAILPPFSIENAIRKVRWFEGVLNENHPRILARCCTADVIWSVGSRHVVGRKHLEALLEEQRTGIVQYRVIADIWVHDADRIALRCVSEICDRDGQWFRGQGCDLVAFGDDGLLSRRVGHCDLQPIAASGRKFFWPLATPRPVDHPGLRELGL